MTLGKLAFFTLFGNKKESSLIFDSKVVTPYMSEQEIDFCLKLGLLCQTKDNTILAERRYKIFFSAQISAGVLLCDLYYFKMGTQYCKINYFKSIFIS
jgi:hypothetical protein